jgi:hypothetical protein
MDICRSAIHYCSTAGYLCRKQQLYLSKVAKCRISTNKTLAAARPATEGLAGSQQSHIVLKVSQGVEQET